MRRLKEDTAKGIAAADLYRYLRRALGDESKEPVAVDDGLLRQVRVGQYSADIVRVVFDMNKVREHNAFMLLRPVSLVIDIQGSRRRSQ